MKKYRSGQKPYIKRDWRHRRDTFARLARDIRLQPGGEAFRSHQVIGGADGAPDDFDCSWADVLFLSEKGRKNGLFYNAMIRSVVDQVVNDIEERIDADLDDRLSAAGLDHSQRLIVSMTRDPQNRGYRVMNFERPYEGVRHGALDGLSEEEFKIRELTLALDLPPTLVMRRSLDKDYRYGIGLHVSIEAERINRRSIEAFIVEFLASGEEAVDAVVSTGAHAGGIQAGLDTLIWREQVQDARIRGREPPSAPIHASAMTMSVPVKGPK